MAHHIQQRGEALTMEAIDLLHRIQNELDEETRAKAWSLIPELQQQFADLQELLTLPEPTR